MAINGFSTCQKSAIGTFKIPGTRRYVPVRREIAPLLVGFSSEFHRLVEPIDSGILDDWGYHCRSVTGVYAAPSFHAAGLALDLNATRHPLGRSGTFNAQQAATIRALCRKYGLRWGGDYRIRKDEMHVEVIIQRSVALALVRRLQSAPAVAPPAPVVRDPNRHVHSMPTFRKGAPYSIYIRDLQGHLNYWRKVRGLSQLVPDGLFGASTDYSVRIFQQAMSTTADGIVGPNTWKKIHDQVGYRRLESDGRGF